MIGSIVGVHKYVYDIFGPAVNLAARMESCAEPMEIAVCSPMKEALDQDFSLQLKSEKELKGFGDTAIYRLDRIIKGDIKSY